MPPRRSALAALFATGVLLVFAVALPGGASGPGGQSHYDATAPRGVLPPRGERPATPGASGQSVIEPDNRVRIWDTTAYPFSAIAYLELYDEYEDLVGTCTGTFVGPDAVLTAGHCLWDPEAGWTQHIRVVPAKDDSYEPFGSQFAENWWVPDAYIDTAGSAGYDWGIIKMPDSELSDSAGWLPIGLVSTETLSRPDFMPAIAGYPGDMPDGTMWGHSVAAFADADAFRLFYDIDTFAGQSGSAIWSLNTDEYFGGYVVGIHTQGTGDGIYNRGSRIDQELLDDILLGCSEMSCEVSWYEEAVPGNEPLPTPTPTPTVPAEGTPGAYEAFVPEVARD